MVPTLPCTAEFLNAARHYLSFYEFRRPYTEPVQSTSRPHTVGSTQTGPVLSPASRSFFFSVFPSEFTYAFCVFQCVLHVPLISTDFRYRFPQIQGGENAAFAFRCSCLLTETDGLLLEIAAVMCCFCLSVFLRRCHDP